MSSNIATFNLGKPGKSLMLRFQKKSYFEVYVYSDKVEIVEINPGLLSPIILTLIGKDIEVDDWWGWGNG